MNKRLLALIAAIIIIIVAIVAIYSLTRPEEPVQNNETAPVIQNETSNQTNETVGPNIIIIQNDSFNPRNLTVPVGTTVQWINRDNTQHQIVSDAGTFQSPVLANGGSYNFYFAQPGVYGYRCGIHPTEIGVITVRS